MASARPAPTEMVNFQALNSSLFITRDALKPDADTRRFQQAQFLLSLCKVALLVQLHTYLHV